MAFFEKFARSARELKNIRCIVVTGVLIALDIVLKMFSIKLTDNIKITFAYLALAAVGMLFGPTVGFIAGAITDVIGFMMNPDGGFNPLFTVVEAVGGMIYGIFLYGIRPVKQDTGELAGKKRPLRVIIPCVLCAGAIVGALFGGITYYLGTFTESEGLLGKTAAVFSGEFAVPTAAVTGFLYGAFFAALIMMTLGSELKISLTVIFSKVTVIVVCNLILTPVAFILSGYMTADALIASYPLRIIKNLVQCPVDCALMMIIMFPLLFAYTREFSPEKRRQ